MSYTDEELHAALSAVQGIDLATGLSHVHGRVRSYWRILQKIPLYHKDDIANLKLSFSSNDFAGIERISHTIKGISANLALPEIYDYSLKINTAIRSQHKIEDIPFFIEELAQSLEQVINEIEEMKLRFPEEQNQEQLDIQALLRELAELLAVADIESTSLFSRYSNLIQKAFPTHFLALQMAMADFDYLTAYSCVQNLLLHHDK